MQRPAALEHERDANHDRCGRALRGHLRRRAWRRGRIRQLRERVEKVLCIFDFEEKLYREAGVPVEYVGHPLLGRVRPRMTREQFFQSAGLDPTVTTVALLPGSRRREVAVHLPIMLDA